MYVVDELLTKFRIINLKDLDKSKFFGIRDITYVCMYLVLKGQWSRSTVYHMNFVADFLHTRYDIFGLFLLTHVTIMYTML